ncbi:BRCA1-associated RING domain protein 1 isoform X2 [Betta splendens]|uniref:BRCA1-associated RING domain protein 1 isoform X2 n=1 Tax=Betta splendens TaxID=158456 RepID=A0A6P7LBQ7_BETSP|nr:BRCA1-associated RING domain protein 1 isoform X2 [Betta splendens]
MMDHEDWKNTKEAVANFRRLLLCSKCSNLMKDPVCLGTCEHMLCRSCAGPCAGDGCMVCHSPAWVKDIQINRQLSSIVQLFSDLESILNPPEPDSIADFQTEPKSPVFRQKKTFKIWFSPRSRKVRCAVEKPSDITVSESRSPGKTDAAQQDAGTAQPKDLSVFNFSSSSQDSGSSSPQRRNPENKNRKNRAAKRNAASKVQGAAAITRKRIKQDMKKRRLAAINQQWGVTEEIMQKEQTCVQETKKPSKRVSFVSPAVTPDKPQPDVPKGNEISTGESLPGVSTTQMNHQDLASQSMSPLKRSRVEEKVGTLETTPKRPRTSPGRRRRSLGRMSPGALRPPSVSSPTTPRTEREDSPSPTAGRGRKSPSARAASVGHPSPGSPAVMKRNHKGETLLHVAAIKGDVAAARELLEQGADPNLKDNAGWTPLHEACNLGHLEVVELLLSRGALLNTPGYKNDSPLHDAARNGHAAIVELLLRHGASPSVLNLYGKQPADYAASVEMLEIFQKASEGNQYANAPPSPSVSLSVVNDCARMEEMPVFLATKLSGPEQRNLAKLGRLLGGRVVDTFSSSVSHVVVPEGHLPTTYSALLGLLAGCWIVRYSWVAACLQEGRRMPETEHEAGDGPPRSRINRCSLLPPLFDGCFFFLLGSFKAPTKDELARLLRGGGGQLLSRQPKPDSDVTQTLSAAAYHALPGSDQALCTQYVVFDPQGPHRPAVLRRGKVWSAPSTWIVDCIAAFQLLPVPEPQISV